MSRKSTLLALAAAATFGLSMVSFTAPASAKGVHSPGGHVSAARVAGPRVSMRIPGNHIRPIFPRRHWHVHYRYPRVWYAARPVVYGAVAPVVSTNRCTCLTKTYTPEGVVVFKDICTNEMAMNPPAVAPTAQVQDPNYQTAPQPR